MLDRARLEELERLGGRPFVRDLLVLFRRDTPVRVEAARSAWAARDLAAAGQAAHPIRGAAGQVGADALRLAARAVEEAAKAGRDQGMDELIRALEREAASALADAESFEGEIG